MNPRKLLTWQCKFQLSKGESERFFEAIRRMQWERVVMKVNKTFHFKTKPGMN